jgi:argininosuccinate lyase
MSRLRERFGSEVDRLLHDFASSLELDLEIADEDFEASLAHAAMLAETGIITSEDGEALARGLQQIRKELAGGAWQPGPEHEDIHMAVEARLVELVGDAGRRLHTARSRNDQVATDVRLWLKRRLAEIEESLSELIGVLLDRVSSDGRTLIPGYTHLQRAQPILLGHHLLAHAWALSRDLERFAGAARHADRSPLGACALAGTPHPVDRTATAERLGFDGVVENAMDAVAARDHLQEAVSCCAICMARLSQMAEELVLWSSAEFRLVRMGEGFATSSSIMPQKANPDGAELVRGKAGGVFADLQTLLVLTKGLPLAYNHDLQEDRPPLYHAIFQTIGSVRLMAAMWRALEVDSDRFEDELRADLSLATELADHLAEQGVPFREAHEAVARLVRWCEEQGSNLTAADSGAARQFHPLLPDDLSPWLDPRAAVERRKTHGGTAWTEVERQVALLREIV